MVEAATVNTTLSRNVAGGTDPAGGDALPDEVGKARFLKAMEGSGPERNAQTAACREGSDGQCIGDAMLNNIQKIKADYDTAVEKINLSVSAVEITPQGLLRLQLEIARLQLQEDLMAKVASKSTQNVDTLLKSQ
jgi:type III secretion system YscI/HrpB-like protein